MAKSRPKRIRRRGRESLVATVAAFFALVSLLVFAFRSSASQVPQKESGVRVARDFDTVKIPVPTRPIAKGEKLGDVPFSWINWPRSRVTSKYVKNPSLYRNSIVVAPIPQLLPVPLSSISDTLLDKNAVVEGIPPGMRAITVRVDAESAVEGWARSGSYVDVILIRKSRQSASGLESRVIAENVRILSAGQSTEPLSGALTAPRAPQTVTLLTTQEDALRIKTAASIGRLTFALRGIQDDKPVASRAVTQRGLLGSGHGAKSKSPVSYRGYAMDSKGRTYVLADGSRWKRTELETNGVFPALSGVEGEKAKDEKVKDGAGEISEEPEKTEDRKRVPGDEERSEPSS